MRLGIKTKIFGGLLIVAAIGAIIGGVGILNLNSVSSDDTFLYQKITVPLGNVADFSGSLNRMRSDALMIMLASDARQVEEFAKKIEARRGVLANSMKAYETTLRHEADRKLFTQLQDNLKEFNAEVDRIIALVASGKKAEANAVVFGGFTTTVGAVNTTIDSLVKESVADAKETSDGNTAVAKLAIIIMIAAIAAGLLLSIALAVFISRSIMKVFAVIEATADNVTSGTGQISASSQQLAQGSAEQASNVDNVSSSVEEVSSSIEELTATIKQNADSAAQTETIANKSAQDAKDSGTAVNQTVKAMKEISERVLVIQEIARQTNLLSLNAAIEAARAGEHGRGFAVVANEVQKLAERSQGAAKEIEDLSKNSVSIAEGAGQMLDHLVPDIQRTADLVSEINAASVEQASGVQQINAAIQQINTSVQQLSSVVQENASGSEELASTAEELASQAIAMSDAVIFLKTGHDDGGMRPEPTEKKPKVAKQTRARELPDRAEPIKHTERKPGDEIIKLPASAMSVIRARTKVENEAIAHPRELALASTDGGNGSRHKDSRITVEERDDADFERYQ